MSRLGVVRGGFGCSAPATLHLNLFCSLSLAWTKSRSGNTLHLPSLQTVELGLNMKLVTGLLAAVLFLAGVGASQAVVRIADDRGGRIGTYVDKYQGLRSSGEAVIIDGLCASACTIVLGAIPHDRICVTSHATLGFHAAWDFGTNGRAITNPEATQMLYSMYPSQVRRWISARGGLTPHMIFLRGKQLESMYKPCYLDAQASAPRLANPAVPPVPASAAAASAASH
jgi:hypothetical protein